MFTLAFVALVLSTFAFFYAHTRIWDMEDIIIRRPLLVLATPAAMLLHSLVYLASFVLDTISGHPVSMPLKDFIEDYKQFPKDLVAIWKGPNV
ncbi:hypothetical protein IB276_22430 [Ensifer sp. ENS04]|uniref:hypothetical protein n=1 Tax=Ensifer sp. ENS04 TaxID=2769281 RepID=UPI0017815716|nr:hypothetical protein [Ensifer sp. ENS04]MBD9542205.1 hypothetical protein [Ensifer sp. ENS04]